MPSHHDHTGPFARECTDYVGIFRAGDALLGKLATADLLKQPLEGCTAFGGLAGKRFQPLLDQDWLQKLKFNVGRFIWYSLNRKHEEKSTSEDNFRHQSLHGLG